MQLLRLLGAILALAVLAASCGDDDTVGARGDRRGRGA